MKTLGQVYLEQLKAEAQATRNCLERIKPEHFDFKPTEKSMVMKNLVLTVSDIPRWITFAIEKGEVDFATYPHFNPGSGEEMAKHFDEVMAEAERVLSNVKDEDLSKKFELKNQGAVLMSSTVGETADSSIRHLVHHRGQLTVYMRLNNIPIPSIYGPSGDDQSF